MKKTLIFLFVFSVISCASAQFKLFPHQSDTNWYKYRRQIYFGGGATQFLGDLGGGNGPGKKFGIGDMDLEATRWQGHLGFRYQFHPLFATSTNLHVGQYASSDLNTSGNRRALREISIKSHIAEISQRFEFIFYAKYKEKEKKEKTKMNRFEAFVFSGIGITFFNPQGGQGTKFEGEYLRPLATEGQGQHNGIKAYSPFTASIPFGFGVQKSFSRRRSIRFELSYMKTFTDYMDDTSGKYYSYAANDIPVSDAAVYYSNPSEDWSTFKNGDPRGGKGKDCYFFASFSFVKSMGMKNKKIKKSKD